MLSGKWRPFCLGLNVLIAEETESIMSLFILRTVPSDGLALLGARASAGVVMTVYVHDWHLTNWDWVTHICVSKLTIIGSMACRLACAKPLSEPMLSYCQIDPKEHISVKFYSKFNSFYSRNAFENVVWQVAAILSRHQCVKSLEVLFLLITMMQIQWNPSKKAIQDGGLSKEVACHEG